VSFQPTSEISLVPDPLADDGGGEAAAPGISPAALAWRRLRRNRVSLAFLGLFVVIVVLCLLAPVYANDIAHTNANTNHLSEVIKLGGKPTDVVSLDGLPIGPTWHSKFFLGADANGRDVAVRLLYGGRNSLEIGAIATLITMFFGVLIGVVSGFMRGPLDALLSRAMDVLWAFPALLLGAAIGVIFAVGGINFGLFKLTGDSLGVVGTIIGVIYIPYVAKPIRGQVLGLREREFVDAARQQGLGSIRIMATEILPNLTSSILVFVPLILANSMILEASLSFLGAGVQQPNPSWGTMIADGTKLLPSSIHLVLIPGLMLTLAVLGVNVFGDGLRDALDPRAKIRVER
jgi:peptide/nickel transport system permease protein